MTRHQPHAVNQTVFEFWFSGATRRPTKFRHHYQMFSRLDPLWGQLAFGQVFDLYRDIGNQLRQETRKTK